MIYYITPYRLDKDIGRAYNDYIKLLPPDSWICLTDGDVMFLQPDWGHFIEEIRANNLEYDLITANTNRLGDPNLCYHGEFSADMDLQHHYKIAKAARAEYGATVEDCRGAGGVLMLFHRKLWVEMGGFQSASFHADGQFCKTLRQRRKKIGIARGLYVFHAYRLWKAKGNLVARASIDHLI
jgi:hypothetical protein